MKLNFNNHIALVTIFVLLSCNSGPTGKSATNLKYPDTTTVEIVHYSSGKPLRRLSKTGEQYMLVQKFSDSTHYSYFVKTDSSLRKLEMDATRFSNDDSLRHSGQKIPLIDQREYLIENQNVNVLKYYFDEVNTYDDECYLYFVDQMGIILIDSKAWYNTQVLFDNKTEFRCKLIDQIKNDTATGFYRRRLN